MDRRSFLRTLVPASPSSRMQSSHLWKLAATAGIAALCGTVALAQGIITGSIAGTAADSSGAVLPGAQVTAKNTATNQTASAVAGADGSFSLNDLPVGQYTLTISDTGFSNLTLNNVLVAASRTSGLGIEKLQTGNTTTTVDVSAAQNIIETTQSQVTTTFDTQQLANLPTGGGFDELALLIPGVVNTHADNFSNSNGVGLSVNGERGRANNFELDGQSNNDNSIAGPQVFFSNDEALAEVQIITDNFAAQYGRNAGSVVNYVTKSGTNSIHGSAIYKFAGDFTSSLAQGYSKGAQFGFCAPGQSAATTGCTPPVVPRFVSNWWGGTLGGPIIKDKLFAFGSTYFQHFNEYGALTSSGNALFPTSAGLATLASAFPNSPGVAVLQQLNPYAVTAGNPRQTGPVVNETITSNGNTVTIPFAQFARQIPSLVSDQEDMGRIDWQATPKDRVYLRYFYQKEPDTPYTPEANGGFVDVLDAVHSVGADITHTFSPNWVDQLRYSFQQSTLAFEGGGFANCTITDFANCPSSITIGGNLSSGNTFTPLGLNADFPQGRIVKNGQVQDNANWSIGHHTITFGGEFDYSNSPNTFLPGASGNFNFDNINDFITGGCPNNACNVSLAIGNPTIPFKENDVAVYFQDDWKVLPTFTLNLGLRWEFFQQAINLLHNESVANQTGANPLWSTALPLSDTTVPSVPQNYKNIEPRFGFAWNPDFNKKLVVRGGYAINVDPAFYNINLNVAANAPMVLSGAVQCTGGAVNCIPTGGATLSNVQQQTGKLLPTGGNPGALTESLVGNNFRNPVGQTYTLGIQYQIRNAAVFEIRYVGNHTSSQFQDLNGNPYLGNVAAAFPNVVNPASLCSAADSTLPGGLDIGRLNCGTSSVNVVANTAFSEYNSVQTNLTTRSYHGVTATFAYTHSNNIDNTSEIFGNAGYGNGGGNTIALAQNPLNTNVGERGTSGIDFPNTASVSMTYKVPEWHTGNDLLNRLSSGWQTNTIWVYNSGQPFTDYENINSSSPQANTPGSGALGAANPGDIRTYQSYNDTAFDGNPSLVGYDVQRPILSNKNAPADTLAIYTTTTLPNGSISAPQLVDYYTGTPVNPSQVRFIANNMLAANLLGNPYPGSGRNILRGDTTNNVDFSVFKNTKITERVNFRLEVDAYDVLNRSYYGTPGNALADYNSQSFNNYLYSYASGATGGGGAEGPLPGVRNLVFGGKILF